MEQSAPPSRWAFHSASGWARYAVAFAGVSAAVAAMVFQQNAFAYTEAAMLGLAGLLMSLDRVDVHVFLRALLWGALAGGVALVLSDGGLASWGLFGGSSSALLALGAAGLDSSQGAFSPRVLRRTLVTMMVVGLSVAHVFIISALVTEAVAAPVLDPVAFTMPSTAFTRFTMFATPVLLVLGVVGLSRTKSWGLFAYLGSLLGVGLTIALSFAWVGDLEPDHMLQTGAATAWVWMMTVLWGFGASLALGAALPVLSALVVRRVPSKQEPRRWGRVAHACLVVLVVAGTLALYVEKLTA